MSYGRMILEVQIGLDRRSLMIDVHLSTSSLTGAQRWHYMSNMFAIGKPSRVTAGRARYDF